MRLIFSFIALLATLSAQGKIEIFKDLKEREWRNESNATIRGILGKYDSARDAVYVMRVPSEGGSFWYPLDKLSAEDVAFVKNEVANLQNVVLPEKLSNQVYFTRASYAEWKWYDPKYLVVEEPVVFDWNERRSRFRTNDRTGFAVLSRCYEFGAHLRPIQRRKGPPPSHWRKSILNLSAILRQYGASERDMAKLKWYYSKEDWLFKTSVILRRFGIDHKVGPYNYKRVKECIENGMPLLAWYTNNLGKKVMTVVTCYYKDERENTRVFGTYGKVYYPILPRN